MTLVLEQNPDIIASITAARKVGQVVVGFALETDDLLKNAQAKLTAKKLDLIVANGVSSIGGSRGQAVILDAQGGKKVISETHKALLARSIIDAALEILPKGKR